MSSSKPVEMLTDCDHVWSYATWGGQFAFGAKTVINACTSFTVPGFAFNIAAFGACWYASRCAEQEEKRIKEVRLLSQMETHLTVIEGNLEEQKRQNAIFAAQNLELRGRISELEEIGEKFKETYEQHRLVLNDQKQAMDENDARIRGLIDQKSQLLADIAGKLGEYEQITRQLAEVTSRLEVENAKHAELNSQLEKIAANLQEIEKRLAEKTQLLEEADRKLREFKNWKIKALVDLGFKTAAVCAKAWPFLMTTLAMGFTAYHTYTWYSSES